MTTRTEPQGALWTREPLSLANPVLLAGTPALGYAIAYFDRLGEAFVYEIPLDYISLSLTDALSRTSLVILSLILVHTVTRLNRAMLDSAPPWAGRAINTASNFLLPSLLVFAASWRLSLFFLSIGAFWTVIDTVVGFLRRKRLKRTTAGDQQRQEPMISEEPSTRRKMALEVSPLLLLVLVASAFVLAFLGGNIRASAKERYLVSANDPKLVLLAVYGGDRGVIGVLDSDMRSLTNERRLVSIPGEITDFRWSQTGSLSSPNGFRFFPLLY